MIVQAETKLENRGDKEQDHVFLQGGYLVSCWRLLVGWSNSPCCVEGVGGDPSYERVTVLDDTLCAIQGLTVPE